MSADIPTIETERLILRGHTRDDFPAFARMWADADVTRFIGGAPLSEEDAWARFLRVMGHWAVLGFGFWAVTLKESGRRIGEVGILDVRREIEPSFHGVPEIGWSLLPEAQGRGYAGEAARAAVAWAEAKFGRVRMVCIIHPDNAPSLKLARRLGFREIARTTYKGEPTVLLERLP